jgi:hypothetical protein
MSPRRTVSPPASITGPLPSDTATVTIAAHAKSRRETRAGRRAVVTATRSRSGAPFFDFVMNLGPP